MITNSLQKPPTSSNNAQHVPVGNIPPEDTILLMHFLDKVFPLQYPMYRPDILEGGRGWLLALLLQTKSLYYAALALSSYHRRMLVFERISEQCRASAAVQQEKLLETCLNEVRQAMVILDQRTQQHKSYDGMGTVTSIVQLVFFEVSRLVPLFLDLVLTTRQAFRWSRQCLENTFECSD